MGSTFLVCTRNRTHELARCVTSILQQNRLPEEVVIVDASDDSAEPLLRALFAQQAPTVNLVYLRAEPGRTRQLNLGIQASSGDPVFINDDDVILEPDFHETILQAFARGGEQVGGVQGTVVGDTYRPFIMRAFRAIFLLSRHTKDGPGRLLPSGYYTTPARPSRLRTAEALRLSALAFRRRVFDDFLFDESLPGYALKEDIDFSYRVSRRYDLVIEPKARFHHHRAPGERLGVRDKSKMHVVNNYHISRKNLGNGLVPRLAFGWAMVGRLIYEAARSVYRRNPDYLRGAVEGLNEALRGKGRVSEQ